jgi:hypothetical protein
MSKNLACLILILGAVLLFSGCSKDNGTSNPLGPQIGGSTTAAFFPLKVGNTWTYAVTQWTTADTTLDTLMTTIQQAATLYGSVTGYRDNHNWWYWITNGELRYNPGPGQPTETSPYQIWIKEPIATGTEWLYSQPTLPDSYKYQIIATNATVSVPAGDFSNCLQINGLPTTELNYYATGIGQVKYRFDEVSHIEWKLVSYTIVP